MSRSECSTVTTDPLHILVVDPDGSLKKSATPILEQQDYLIHIIDALQDVMSSVYSEPPDLILLSCKGDGWLSILEDLKKDTVYGHLPLIAVLKQGQNLNGIVPDDFIYEGFSEQELMLRVRYTKARAYSQLDANPLTRLPGNLSIRNTIQNKIDNKESFALCYLDIDNFKIYNDKYGFSRGDAAIRMTARIMANAVRRIAGKGGFVGHVGGDDFVFIVSEDIASEVCEQTIHHFDMIAPTLYDEEDRLRGWISSVDREGNPCKSPLISISIAVILPLRQNITHPEQAGQLASVIKSVAKKLNGSTYLIDTSSGLPQQDDKN